MNGLANFGSQAHPLDRGRQQSTNLPFVRPPPAFQKPLTFLDLFLPENIMTSSIL